MEFDQGLSITPGTRTDAPAEKDSLDIQNYVHALARFVSECETPMTVAVQGDWGSGKTSLMKMVAAQARSDSCLVVDFNTWQYSQFQMGDNLVLALMEHLILSIGRGDEKDGYDVRRLRAGILACLKGIALGAFDVVGSGLAQTVPFGAAGYSAAKKVAGDVRDTMNDYVDPDSLQPQFRGQTAVVESLHEALAEYVDKALAARAELFQGIKPDQMRLVVMIDDLDRLPPERAVEVMEALKVFLDIKRCVYILAIDFDVVKQGVRHKFGQTFDQKKAIAFFDKIIQVPFHMPVEAYKIDAYLREIMKFPRGLPESVVASFVSLAGNSVGNNPRSLKRLANTFHLLRGMDEDLTVPDAHRMFGTLCMQAAFPLYYQDFVSRCLHELASSEEPDITAFFDEEIDMLSGAELQGEVGENRSLLVTQRESRLESYGMTESDAVLFAEFVRSFRGLFVDGERTEDLDVAALTKALKRAAVTSIGENVSRVNARPTGMQYGREGASQALRDLGASGRPLEMFEELTGRLAERLVPHFEMGVAPNEPRVSLYSDGTKLGRGAFCYLKVGQRTLGVQFAPPSIKNAHRVDDWVSRAEGRFTVSRSYSATAFQIRLKAVQDLDADDVDLLAELLAECHAATRERYFATSGETEPSPG